MTLWITMFAAGLITFAIRYSFIGAGERFTPPPWFTRALRFVPIAALTALVWPDLFIIGGTVKLADPRCLAGLVAVIVIWRTRSVLATIVIGMSTLWLLKLVAGAAS
ncbi:MAG: AzlD domain-containing protein [Burkholderiales bacterium]